MSNSTNCCPGTVSCCGNLLPDKLTAKIANGSNCACANGASIPLTWDPINQVWSGTAAMGSCGTNISLNFMCSGSSCAGFSLVITSATPCIVQSSSQNGGCTCQPLNVAFTFNLMGLGCCGNFSGTESITITVQD